VWERIPKTDNGSTGAANAFVGTLNHRNPQQLDHLEAKSSISANHTPQRLAASVVEFARERPFRLAPHE
jgi:hypothetical protein